MHDLGTLGGTHSDGHGINASGQVTGYSRTTGDAAYHAFLYDGTMHDLGTLGGTDSYGLGINDSGQVTGYSHTTGDATYHAFLYTSGSWHGGFEFADRSAIGLGVIIRKRNQRRRADHGIRGDRRRATRVFADPRARAGEPRAPGSWPAVSRLAELAAITHWRRTWRASIRPRRGTRAVAFARSDQ